jgi:hypothetical protein
MSDRAERPDDDDDDPMADYWETNAEGERVFVLDRDHDLPVFSPQCVYCTHLIDNGLGRRCDAFPEKRGVPRSIWLGDVDHRVPYPNDNGIQFEPVNELGEDRVAALFTPEGRARRRRR